MKLGERGKREGAGGGGVNPMFPVPVFPIPKCIFISRSFPFANFEQGQEMAYKQPVKIAETIRRKSGDLFQQMEWASR